MSVLSDALAIIKGLLGMRGQPKRGKRVDVRPLPPKTREQAEEEDTQPFPRRKPRGRA